MNEWTMIRRKGLKAGLWLQVLGLLWMGAPGLEAGSVFMKNGYIIQGPLVEQDDELVVLGWENGKVTIYRRFIESVSFDPGEESRLEKAALKREQQDAEAEEIILQASAAVEIDDLPADLDVFLKLYGGGTSSPEGGDSGLPADDGAGAGVGSGATGEPVRPGDGTSVDPVAGQEPPPDDGTLQPVATPVDPPPAQLAERIFTPGRDFSLQPPAGWTVAEKQGVLTAVGPRAPSGVEPSINVLSLPRGGLPVEELLRMVKEEHQAILGESYEVLREGEQEFATGSGYEIVARGTFAGRTLVLRQVVLPLEEKVWLVSGFSEGGAADSAAGALEAALRTLATSPQ